MFGKVRIRKHELGLLFRYGDFRDVLRPGKYRLWSRLSSKARAQVEVVNTLDTRFEHKLLDVLVREPTLRDALTVVDLEDNQRALVWKDGRLAYIVGPGRHAFWRESSELTVEVFNVEALHFSHPKMDAVLKHADAPKWLAGLEVNEYETVLFSRDGQITNRLGKGRYVYWKDVGRVTWKCLDLREQVLDVAGQEIMTQDKVTLRVNLLVTYQVLDPYKAVVVVNDHVQALYREAQLALRAAVGTRSLDALLADKESVGGEVRNAIAQRATEFGVVIRGVGLRDIILPGEMKTILNQVIEAEKAAQANLIKRREETAAARSQANTARLLAENPILARMKELEILQDVLSGAKLTFVLGEKDLAGQLRKLVRGAEPDT